MAELIQSFLAVVSDFEPLLVEYGLIIIFVAILIEGVVIPLPGQSLLIVGALLSSRGQFDISVLLLWAWVAAFAGSTLGYVIGRVGGRKILLRLPLNPSRLARMDAFCKRYGVLLVLLSRFVDGPRQLTGIFVGSLHMPVTTFLLASSVGAVIWVGFWGLGSYYLGQHIHVVVRVFESIAPYTWIATGLLVLALCFYLVRRHNHRKSTAGK